MKINWKLRLQNKATFTTIIFTLIAIVYKVLGFCGVIPAIAQGQIEELAELIIFVLCLFGILIDPTTAGTSDSARAMRYEEPYKAIDEMKREDKK